MSGEYRLGSLAEEIAKSCGVSKPEFDPKLASLFQPKKSLKRLVKVNCSVKTRNDVALPPPAKPRVKPQSLMRNQEAADIRLGAKAKFSSHSQQSELITVITPHAPPAISNGSVGKRSKVKKRKERSEEVEMSSEPPVAEEVTPTPPKQKKSKKVKRGEEEVKSEVNVEDEIVERKRSKVSKTEELKKTKGSEGVKNTVEQQNTPKDKDPELESRTIYVGNVPKDLNKKQLLKLFRQFGDIDTLRLRCGAPDKPKRLKKVAINKKELHPDRNSLAAYIRYKTREEAEEAMKIGNGMEVQDHHLIVDLADNSAKKDNKKAIFVGNLHLKVHDDELWKLFEDCGKVESVRVIRDRDTGMGKGFGYVNFLDNSSVELALQKDGTDLKNRALRISRCVKKLKNKDSAGGGGSQPSSGSKGSSNKKFRSQGRKQRGEVMEFAGDTTAEIGKFKRNSKKPNIQEVKKARVAKQLAGPGSKIALPIHKQPGPPAPRPQNIKPNFTPKNHHKDRYFTPNNPSVRPNNKANFKPNRKPSFAPNNKPSFKPNSKPNFQPNSKPGFTANNKSKPIITKKVKKPRHRDRLTTDVTK